MRDDFVFRDRNMVLKRNLIMAYELQNIYTFSILDSCLGSPFSGTGLVDNSFPALIITLAICTD